MKKGCKGICREFKIEVNSEFDILYVTLKACNVFVKSKNRQHKRTKMPFD